jgi:serine/threonine protein kinase
MTFPNSLSSQFELIEQLPGEKAIDCFRVRDVRREWNESVVRFLPEKFSADREIVNRFYSFFSQFSAIPNRTFLPAVYSVTGVAGGNVFAVEEYVTGVPLPRFIELRRTSETLRADVIEILVNVCEALHHAHQRDIYHLCISPADVLVDIKNPGRVKLVGFGTQIFSMGGRFDSFSGHCKGHIAPEILDGREPKPSADIYSVAAAIRDVFPEIGDYGDLLSRGLSRNPADRPARAREFAQGLKELINKKTTLTSDKPKQNTTENAGGLLPIVHIKSDPIGAEVKLNGKVVGITSDKGLSLSCGRDAVIEISKGGYETETISFPDFGSKSEFVVKLKSAFRLFTNPWGAIVRVDGSEIGTTTREGMVVPWDGHTIEVQKSGYKPETLKFVTPPTETASYLELKMLAAAAPKKEGWPKIAPYILAGFLLCLAPVLIYNGIYGGPKADRKLTDKDDEIAKLTTVVADLRGNLNQKDIEIANLKKQVESEKGRWETSEKRAANLENEISRLKASLASQQQSVIQKSSIDHSFDDSLVDACTSGDNSEVERLLNLGADPNARRFGWTALIFAVSAERIEIIKLLLKFGADVDQITDGGKKAADFAKNSGNGVLSLLENHRRKQKHSP